MEEAKDLMSAGNTTSPAAMDIARRFLALGRQLTSATSPITALKSKLQAMLVDARADPKASQKLEIFSFLQKSVATLNAQEGDAKG